MIRTSSVSVENFFEKSVKKTIITDSRKSVLSSIAVKIAMEYSQNKTLNLNFICTHNSRRSQISQLWANYAAHYFNLNIDAFSGGTEVTAFHRNAVKTLQKSGFGFQLLDFSHQNPTYEISFRGANKSIIGFSKLYDHNINKTPFIAITTCNNADENCPFIPEASQRHHLPFVDPKYSDATEKQEEVYLKTNLQIAGELFYLFSEIAKKAI